MSATVSAMSRLRGLRGVRGVGGSGAEKMMDSDTASVHSVQSDHSFSSSMFSSNQSHQKADHQRETQSKGTDNILVAVRVRPGLPKEPPEIHEHLFDMVKDGALPEDAKKLAFDTENCQVSGRKDYDVVPHVYNFDTTFGPTATNPGVYEKAVKPVVDSVLEGYHATVFAYGMTGSGKTHTMVGSLKDPGMIPLSFEQIFKQVEENKAHTDFNISISYLEIYCEMVRDIIDPGRDNLDIREDKDKGVFIQNISKHEVTSWKETKSLLDQGMENRAVTATEMNAESSRSHAILIARITRENKATQERSQAKLFLVDLAGSERIGKSGVTGVALEEAKAINLSLSTLGLCIKALVAANKPHVPFRSSKLTRLLRESLGGKARTCLIIAVRPGQPHIEETLSALQFGARARKIKVHASKNVHKNWKLEFEKLQLMYNTSKDENAKLTRKVSSLKRKLRAGEGGSDYSSSDDDDSSEDIGVGAISHDIEKGRRASLLAANTKKSKLKIQMKEMQKALETKLAEAQTNHESKDAEIEGLKLQNREQKKHAASMTALVESLQEDVFKKDLELTELNATNKRLEVELDDSEQTLVKDRAAFMSRITDLTLALKNSQGALESSHEELRMCELELRRSGAENQILHEKIDTLEMQHKAEVGQVKIAMKNLKKELHSKTSKLKTLLRAAEHRYREMVVQLHKKEDEVADIINDTKALQERVDARAREVERGRASMVLERCHSERMTELVSSIRSQILRLHISAGKGADRSLQKASLHFSRNDATRKQQLHLEYNSRIPGDRPQAFGADLSGGQTETTSVVDKFQDVLQNSVVSLIADVRAQSCEDEEKLWHNERVRLSQDLTKLRREKNGLQEENKKQRERTEYALNLVKAIRPLVKSM